MGRPCPSGPAVDGEHVVADLRVDADLGQRRPVNLLFVLSLEDREILYRLEALSSSNRAPGSADTRAHRRRYVAAIDIGVLHGQFGDHLADDVVQVGAMRDVFQQRFVLLTERLPIVAVHIRRVEKSR